MTGTEIIKKFELWTDDQTELSTDEELFLANQKAKEIYNEVTWEFLRKTATGSFSGGEINLATVAPDFKYAMANYSDDPSYGTPTTPVVYVGGARVVDHDVGDSECGHARLDQVPDSVAVGHVARHKAGLVGAQLLGQSLALVLRQIRDHDACAFLHVQTHDGFAKARGATSDDGDLLLQLSTHSHLS